MMRFEHETLGQRVLFAAGGAAGNLAAEVARRGARKVMVIASKRESAAAEAVIAGVDVALHYDETVQHVPRPRADAARAAAQAAGIDLLVAIGGGSAIGLAKAVALTSSLPIVAVPTTYAGSEATNVWGITEGARKTTGVDNRVLPATVIYDPELTYSMPVALSVASGLNAVAHCIDSMWAPRTDPINRALAAEGLRALAIGLPMVKDDPAGGDGRQSALYGAYLAAVSFASAGSGMHHKICHVLGGAYNLPHAETHAIVLPYVLAFNAAAAPDAAARIAAAFGSPRATDGLQRLRDRLNAPRALRDYGLTEANIPEAVRLSLAAIPASNPRPVTADNLTTLLTAAWAGQKPSELEIDHIRKEES
jgi:maleylacetate reductase